MMVAPRGPSTHGLGAHHQALPQAAVPRHSGLTAASLQAPRDALLGGGLLSPHSRGARSGLPAAPSTGVRAIYGSVPWGSFCSSLGGCCPRSVLPGRGQSVSGGNRGQEGDWRGGGSLPPALSCSSYHSMLRDLGRKADSSAEAYSAFLLFSCFCLTDKRWANLERLLSDLGKGRGKALMSLQHPGSQRQGDGTEPPDAGGCKGHRGLWESQQHREGAAQAWGKQRGVSRLHTGLAGQDPRLQWVKPALQRVSSLRRAERGRQAFVSTGPCSRRQPEHLPGLPLLLDCQPATAEAAETRAASASRSTRGWEDGGASGEGSEAGRTDGPQPAPALPHVPAARGGSGTVPASSTAPAEPPLPSTARARKTLLPVCGGERTSPTAARHRRPPRAVRAGASVPWSPDRLQLNKIPLKTQ